MSCNLTAQTHRFLAPDEDIGIEDIEVYVMISVAS